MSGPTWEFCKCCPCEILVIISCQRFTLQKTGLACSKRHVCSFKKEEEKSVGFVVLKKCALQKGKVLILHRTLHKNDMQELSLNETLQAYDFLFSSKIIFK